MTSASGGAVGRWTAAEEDALHELPHAAQVLYLRGLRRYMDKSGVVGGPKRRISRRMLIETLTVPSRRGRHSREECAPTLSTVRHLLGILVDAGLVRRFAIDDFIFLLPLATQGQSVSGMSSPMSAPMSSPMSSPMSAPMSAPSKVSDGAGIPPMSSPMSAPMSAPMSSPMSSPMSAPHLKDLPLGNTESADSPTSRAGATVIGQLCRQLRQDAGMRDAHPHRPELIAAIADGISPDVLIATALELSDTRGVPSLGYLLGTVRGRIRDSQSSTEVYHAVGIGRRASVCEQNEEQDKTLSELEQRGHPHLTIVK